VNACGVAESLTEEVFMARYTRSVGRFYRRAASLLLIAVLGWGPAAGSLCQALCSDPREATATESNVNGPHHHEMVTEDATAAHSKAGAAHRQHRSPGTTSATSHGMGLKVEATRLPIRDCCDGFVQNTSAAAVRADANLVLSPHAATMSWTASAMREDRQPSGPTHGSPPGGSASAPVSAVLRI
jgi:hypothetical protein